MSELESCPEPIDPEQIHGRRERLIHELTIEARDLVVEAELRPDEALSLRAEAADVFGQALAQNLHRMAEVVRRRVKDPDSIPDIVQEASLSAWRSLGLFRAEAPASAWLCIIAASS